MTDLTDLIHGEFAETCLDFYDIIRFGTRKERKRAAQDLVIMAVAAYDELRALKRKEGEPTTDVPAAPSSLDPDGHPPTGGTPAAPYDHDKVRGEHLSRWRVGGDEHF